MCYKIVLVFKMNEIEALRGGTYFSCLDYNFS